MRRMGFVFGVSQSVRAAGAANARARAHAAVALAEVATLLLIEHRQEQPSRLINLID